MFKLLSIVFTGLLLLTGCQFTKNFPNEPKMPYKVWRLSGSYPHYFEVRARDAVVRTQTNKLYSSSVSILDDNEQGKWSDYPGGVGGEIQPYDLPSYIGICWMSYFDQKIYWTEINISLETRKKMILPAMKFPLQNGKPHDADYFSTLVIGFEPKGNVKVWLNGPPADKAPLIAEAKSIEITDNNHYCKNWNPSGTIPQISDEGKRWIKANGLPESW